MSIPTAVHEDLKLSQAVRELALEGYEKPGKIEFESREKYAWLRDLGSSLWLDTGDAEAAQKVWSRELEALTTNNTLVNQVVRTGALDGLIAYAARKIRDVRPGISDRDLIVETGFLVNAKLALGLVQRFGAHVSVELHPDVGFDVQKTLAYARRYYDINPDYFYVKAPLTPDGFVATRLLSAEGVPVNYTLGFSARQNYLAALFSRPRFVNVFLGRLNSLVEENGLGRPENVGEKAALASYEAVAELREAHRDLPTQQIAASLRSGSQVAALVGVDVLTMPPKAAEEYLELDITRNDLCRYGSQDLRVELNPEKPVETSQLGSLWLIDARFIDFAQDAAAQADQMTSGRELVELSRRHAVNLFSEWSAEERQRIREKGKIPDLSQWPGRPVDDLMSISALESFAKDQEELDERIAGLVRQV